MDKSGLWKQAGAVERDIYIVDVVDCCVCVLFLDWEPSGFFHDAHRKKVFLSIFCIVLNNFTKQPVLKMTTPIIHSLLFL